MPAYATEGAAGLDLVAAVESDLVLASLERAAVPTGLELAVPPGYEAQLRARSGRALREGLALVNAPGTIDADYRGEVKVIVVNHDRERPIRLRRLDRVAQLVVQRVEQVGWREVDELPTTARGSGGHGSTGGYEREG